MSPGALIISLAALAPPGGAGSASPQGGYPPGSNTGGKSGGDGVINSLMAPHSLNWFYSVPKCQNGEVIQCSKIRSAKAHLKSLNLRPLRSVTGSISLFPMTLTACSITSRACSAYPRPLWSCKPWCSPFPGGLSRLTPFGRRPKFRAAASNSNTGTRNGEVLDTVVRRAGAASGAAPDPTRGGEVVHIRSRLRRSGARSVA